MIKKPSDTETERLWMKINGKLSEDYTINVVTGVIEIRENFKDKKVMTHENKSGAYIKFGEGVANHWVKPEVPSAATPPQAAPPKPYAPMFEEVSQLRLDQFDGMYPYTAAYSVEPIDGLNLTVIISSKHSAVDENDLLNGLTEMLSYIHKQTDRGSLKL